MVFWSYFGVTSRGYVYGFFFLWPFPMDGEVLAQLLTCVDLYGLAWFWCLFGYECLFFIGV